MLKSFKNLSGFEIKLWIVSVLIVTASFFAAGEFNFLTLIASLIGVTALIFVAKGDVLGQILTVVFSVMYAIISYNFKYYGEMITYVGMTAPIAVLSIITWIKNPYSEKQVKVHHIGRWGMVVLFVCTTAVTVLFYFILKAFGTANLFFSTISVFTSFLASALMMLRSPYYAVAYAANDIVLIILWVLASVSNIGYLPMIACFVMFLANDVYGFKNWIKMQQNQTEIKK